MFRSFANFKELHSLLSRDSRKLSEVLLSYYLATLRRKTACNDKSSEVDISFQALLLPPYLLQMMRKCFCPAISNEKLHYSL